MKFEKKTGFIELLDYRNFKIHPDDWIKNIGYDKTGISQLGNSSGVFKML